MMKHTQMVDSLLFVILGVVVIIMTVYGGALSAKSLPPEHNRKVHLWMFVCLGLLAALLTICTGFRNYFAKADSEQQQRSLTKSLQDTQDQLTYANSALKQNQLSEEFIKGQLNSLSSVVGKMDATGNAGYVAVAKTLKEISTGAATSGLTPVQRMTNEQLRSSVIQLSKDMVAAAAEFAPKSSAAAMSEQRQQIAQVYADFDAKIRQNFLGTANEYRDEMLRRLGEKAPPPKDWDTFWHDSSASVSINTFSVRDSAQYLDELARLLPESASNLKKNR